MVNTSVRGGIRGSTPTQTPQTGGKNCVINTWGRIPSRMWRNRGAAQRVYF